MNMTLQLLILSTEVAMQVAGNLILLSDATVTGTLRLASDPLLTIDPEPCKVRDVL